MMVSFWTTAGVVGAGGIFFRHAWPKAIRPRVAMPAAVVVSLGLWGLFDLPGAWKLGAAWAAMFYLLDLSNLVVPPGRGIGLRIAAAGAMVVGLDLWLEGTRL